MAGRRAFGFALGRADPGGFAFRGFRDSTHFVRAPFARILHRRVDAAAVRRRCGMASRGHTVAPLALVCARVDASGVTLDSLRAGTAGERSR